MGLRTLGDLRLGLRTRSAAESLACYKAAEAFARADLSQQLPQARGRIFPGIGLVANESELGPDQLFEQIEVTRRLGAPGYALFKLDTPFVKRILPLMRVGMNRQ